MRSRDNPAQGRSSNPQQAGAPPFLWWIVGVMALIELVLSSADANWIGSPEWRWAAIKYGGFWQQLFAGSIQPLFSGQFFTMFVSHAFLHGGITHFVLNSVVLLALGKTVYERVGFLPTILTLLLSAIGGALAYGTVSAGAAPMIGASGAVFGLLGAWQCWDYRLRRRLHMPIQPVLGSVLALVVVNVVLFFALDGALAWEAHLGGWLVGCVAAATFARQ